MVLKKSRQTKAEFREGIDRAVSHTAAAGRLLRLFKETLPSDVGCLVLTFDQHGGPGHMGYASTGAREDCIKLLHEFLANFEGN